MDIFEPVIESGAALHLKIAQNRSLDKMNQNDSSVDFEVPYVFVMIRQWIVRYPMFF
jgi:hypothetical protein